MSQVEVRTPLSQECGTVNLLAVGHPILVIVSHKEERDSASSPSSSPPSELVTATANRLLTGTSLVEGVRVSATENGDHVVTLDPEVREKEDYSLSVFYKREHVPGSPFLLRFVEPLALSSVHTERRRAVTNADRLINFIVPLEASGEVDATVEGPFGKYKVDVRRFSMENTKESVSLYFEPKGLGAYTVHLTVDQKEVENSPFLILADFSNEEARKCHVFPEDEHLFKKRLRFKGNGEGTSFRVFTQTAVKVSRGPGELSVLCWGPKEAEVRLSKDPDGCGLEMCEVVPSAPGDYRLSILWKGQHICASPRVLQFRRPKSKIVASGLNLQSQTFHLGVPYRFKLNCSSSGGGAPDITCEPHSACDISVTPVGNTDGSMHKCELVPKISGIHTLGVQFNGREISGSPFKVKFEDTCNPAACKIVQSSKTYTAGGILGLKVSTEGAGPGTLEATAEDLDTHIAVSLTTKQVSADIYQLEFNPGESTECNLSVTYSKRHIPGSPFKLFFNNPNKFVLKGDGLMGGRVGVWNTFTVQLNDPPLGALGVTVNGSDGTCAKTTITPVAKHKFEVKYLPTVSGQHTIRAKWGKFPIPGSPFGVNCTSAVFQLRGVLKRAQVGSKLSFEASLVSGGPLEKKDSLEVLARSVKGGKLRRKAILVERGEEQVYTCSFTPRVTGNHLVSVKWNKLDIEGSPFNVKVVAAPKPENVRVYGPGVEFGEVGQAREFTIETGAAGGGLLAMKIKGPTKELQFSTRQDPRNKRTLHTKYNPTLPGWYCIEVQWAGKHVPGSPFNVDLFPPTPASHEDGKLTVTAEVHPECMATATSQAYPGSLTVDMEGLGKRDMSLSQDSSYLDGGLSLSQDSRLDTSFGEMAFGHKSCSPSGEEYPDQNHVSIYVEDRDSVCSNGPRKIHSYDAEVQFFKRPALTSQGSLDSLESSTSSLYDVLELNKRRLSDEQISIQLDGVVSFT